MPQVNVSRVLSNPRFQQNFTVHRKTDGHWVKGKFIQTESDIQMSGVITPGGTNDIVQVPEGDRTSQLVIFHSKQPIYITRDNAEKGTSDEIEWKGERYRILRVMDWQDFGYFRAYGISVRGY